MGLVKKKLVFIIIYHEVGQAACMQIWIYHPYSLSLCVLHRPGDLCARRLRYVM